MTVSMKILVLTSFKIGEDNIEIEINYISKEFKGFILNILIVNVTNIQIYGINTLNMLKLSVL